MDKQELEEKIENIGKQIWFIAPKRQIVEANIIAIAPEYVVAKCKNKNFIILKDDNVFLSQQDAKTQIEENYKLVHKNYNRDKLNNVYWKIKDRCYNKNSNAYINYGAIGITMCEEWFNSYQTFKKWALSNGYREEIMENGRNRLTIDRIDVYGNYEPSNCRWVDMKTQQNNRTNNISRRIKQMEGNKDGI